MSKVTTNVVEKTKDWEMDAATKHQWTYKWIWKGFWLIATISAGLISLLLDGETLDHLMSLSPEELLLRWVNYHLMNAGTKKICNFSEDIKVLLRTHTWECTTAYWKVTHSGASAGLAGLFLPAGPDRSVRGEGLQEHHQDRHERPEREPVCFMSDCEFRRATSSPRLFAKEENLEQRAELMLRQAARLDCRQFVSPHDVTLGNSKLNLAFVANLFNMHPALEKTEISGIETAHIEGEICFTAAKKSCCIAKCNKIP